LFDKPNEKRTFKRRKCKLEGDIKTDLGEKSLNRWIGFNWLGIEANTRFFKSGNEIPGCMKSEIS
jgi:hypothetical protein